MSNRSRLIGPRGLVSALAVAFLLIAVPGALADQSFTDPTGDAGSAPDIGAVSATNDPAGNITLTIATNEPQLDPNAAFFAYFDTDSNGATGLQEAVIGAELSPPSRQPFPGHIDECELETRRVQPLPRTGPHARGTPIQASRGASRMRRPPRRLSSRNSSSETACHSAASSWPATSAGT